MSEETKEETQNSSGTVPSYRLREESEKRRKAEEQLSKILEEVKGLKTALSEAHSKLDTTSSVHEQDIALISAGIIDPEVQGRIKGRREAQPGCCAERQPQCGHRSASPEQWDILVRQRH